MSQDWFVRPETVRLPLTDGWIEVKRELNTGESAKLYARTVKGGVVVAGEKTPLDPEKLGIERAIAYITAWSASVPVSEAAIRQLKGYMFAEIVEAIDAHVVAQDAAREEEKKLRNTATSLRAV